jgi:hypothetical protein
MGAVARLLGCCALAFALATSVAACGDSGGGSGANASKAATTASAKSDPYKTGALPAELADIGERLDDAGYDAAWKRPARSAVGLVRVAMKAGGYAFISTPLPKRTLADGVRDGKPKLSAKGRVLSQVLHRQLFAASNAEDIFGVTKKKLSSAQKAEFNEIVGLFGGA